MNNKNLKIFDMKKDKEERDDQITQLSEELDESESIRAKHNKILEKNKEVL